MLHRLYCLVCCYTLYIAVVLLLQHGVWSTTEPACPLNSTACLCICRIQFQYDIVPMVPCAPQVTACRTTPVPTTQPDNTGLWHYSTIGGGIDFVATDMPQQPQAWALLCNLDFTQIKMFFLASHTCSYECYFSQYASDANNNCLLKSAITDGGIGTFCTGALAAFPDAATPQYPSKACLSAP
eukprot:GHUV01027043.1.p1 GENE.GHUV01027043.1~~GHUV01027043.1.p1  ORF type:complete len:183 (+),score=21.62 GHUV01027043.1:1019-1567(+)